MHRLTTPALLLTATLGLGACGGDDGGDALDRAALVKKADAICAKANTDSQAIKAPAAFDDPKVAADYFDKIVPITQKETDALGALEADDEAKADLAALVTAQSEANDLLKTIDEKARESDASGQADLAKVVPAGEKFSAAAKKLGAKGCAS